MSSSERHRLSKRLRILCAACQERKAKFRYRGEVRSDPDHTLCFECYRGEINRARARRLIQTETQPRIRSLFGYQQATGGRLLDDRQLAHRQRMLDHLRQSSVACSACPPQVRDPGRDSVLNLAVNLIDWHRPALGGRERVIAVLDHVQRDGSGESIEMRTQLVWRPERIAGALDEESRHADRGEVRHSELE